MHTTVRLDTIIGDLASMQTEIHEINTHIAILNDDYTSMNKRVTSLETAEQRKEAEFSTIKRIGYIGFTILGILASAGLLRWF